MCLFWPVLCTLKRSWVDWWQSVQFHYNPGRAVTAVARLMGSQSSLQPHDWDSQPLQRVICCIMLRYLSWVQPTRMYIWSWTALRLSWEKSYNAPTSTLVIKVVMTYTVRTTWGFEHNREGGIPRGGGEAEQQGFHLFAERARERESHYASPPFPLSGAGTKWTH